MRHRPVFFFIFENKFGIQLSDFKIYLGFNEQKTLHGYMLLQKRKHNIISCNSVTLLKYKLQIRFLVFCNKIGGITGESGVKFIVRA